MTLLKTLAASAAVAALSFGTANAAHMAFSLGDNGNTLVQFAPDGTGFTGVDLSGDAESLDTITYRPETGQLYGYSQDSDSFFLIDPMTGATSLVFESSIDVDTDIVGLDFNPTLDAVRLVSVAGDNIVYDPNGGTVTRVTDIFYDEGYSSELVGPNVIGNAYTNQVPEAEADVLGTTQYVLDSQTDTLGILGNNNGDIDRVGALTMMSSGEEIDFASVGGFDIFTSPDGENIAYALLTTVNGTAFYEIDLGLAVASMISTVSGEFGPLQGLAVFVPTDPIPLPAAGVLFLTGAGAIGAMRRRKRAA